MKIGVDCRLAGIKHAGIGRYIEELVKRVIVDESVQWVLFFYEPNQIELPALANVKIVIAPIKHYSLAEQILLPFVFYRENLDLLHVPHYNVPLLYLRKFVITIHDLLWHTRSNADATTLSPLMHAFKYQAYKRVVHHAAFWASKILVPARYVKEEVLRTLAFVSSDKIVVTYEGVNRQFSIFNSQFSIPRSKILFYTGSLYPHKNLMLVVHALKKLPEYSLLISSARTPFVEDFMKRVASMGLSDRVTHLGRLSDEELISWYKKSAALVQPSQSEGFGLTGVEAMAVGLPVLASEIAIFKEIYQDGCLYFDPKSIDSFVKAVHQLETLDSDAQIKRGVAIASKYSWDTMAKETLEIYKKLL